jgi:hypothetical protein
MARKPKKDFIHPEWPYDAERENAKFLRNLYKTFLRRPLTPGRENRIFLLPYLITYNVCYLVLISPPMWRLVNSLICYMKMKETGLALLIVMKRYLSLNLQKKILHIVLICISTPRYVIIMTFFLYVLASCDPPNKVYHDQYHNCLNPQVNDAYYSDLNKKLFKSVPRLLCMELFFRFIHFVLRRFFALIN